MYETNAQALAGAAYDEARRQLARIDDLTARIETLERDSHAPFDFTHLIARLDALEKGESRPAQLCNYDDLPVEQCKVERCRRLGYCPWAGRQP
jgi:hypothetical protein